MTSEPVYLPPNPTDVYHTDPDCQRLKQGVEKTVAITEAKGFYGLRECRFCGGDVEHGAHSNERCEATASDGTRCGHTPLAGSDYCLAHLDLEVNHD